MQMAIQTPQKRKLNLVRVPMRKLLNIMPAEGTQGSSGQAKPDAGVKTWGRDRGKRQRQGQRQEAGRQHGTPRQHPTPGPGLMTQAKQVGWCRGFSVYLGQEVEGTGDAEPQA